jgi:hypothetical protein
MTGLPFWPTVLRLLFLGLATALGSMAMLIAWLTLTEGTKGADLAIIYMALFLGVVVAVAVVPSYLLWFLLVAVLFRTAAGLRGATVLASGITAALVGGGAGLAISVAAGPGFGVGEPRLIAILAGLAAVVAVPLTLFIIPVPKDASRT